MICKSYKLLYFLLPLSFTQCAINKRELSSKDSDLVKKMVVFAPYAQIALLDTKSKLIRSETISSEAEKEIKTQLIKYIPSNVNTRYLETENHQYDEGIVTGSIKLIKAIKRSLSPNFLEAPDVLINALDSLGENYGLFLFQEGFTRTAENLKNDYIKRKSFAIASLGFYNTVPNESYSVMIGILIDRKRKKVSMYKELYFRNKNPNDVIVIRNQVRDIILTYFNG